MATTKPLLLQSPSDLSTSLILLISHPLVPLQHVPWLPLHKIQLDPPKSPWKFYCHTSSPPVAGEQKLFSNVTRLGFAAGHNSPSLKIEKGNTVQNNEVATNSTNVAGSRNSGTPSFANVISRAKAVENLDTPKVDEMGKKGKKASRVVLSTAGGRRY